jgi:hypothetical protein
VFVALFINVTMFAGKVNVEAPVYSQRFKRTPGILESEEEAVPVVVVYV